MKYPMFTIEDSLVGQGHQIVVTGMDGSRLVVSGGHSTHQIRCRSKDDGLRSSQIFFSVIRPTLTER